MAADDKKGSRENCPGHHLVRVFGFRGLDSYARCATERDHKLLEYEALGQLPLKVYWHTLGGIGIRRTHESGTKDQFAKDTRFARKVSTMNS